LALRCAEGVLPHFNQGAALAGILHALRHLHRPLKSDDLIHLWDKLDTTLRDAVARIRGLPSSTDHLDAAPISLLIKMGGLGSCPAIWLHTTLMQQRRRRQTSP
jgi:hypothetical protein